MSWFKIAGLVAQSTIDLPQLAAISPDGGPADVTIREGAVPQALGNPEKSGPIWEIAGQSFLMRIPEVARFLLRDGREIVFERLPGVVDDDIAIFLAGTVFGLLLHQRGQIVLHASAIQVGGKAVLFCGRSGAGKSTLAAALERHGYPLMNDDVCALEVPAAGRRPPIVMADCSSCGAIRSTSSISPSTAAPLFAPISKNIM